MTRTCGRLHRPCIFVAKEIDKPNSVPSAGGDHLSGSAVADALKQPTRSLCTHPFLIPPKRDFVLRSALFPRAKIDGGGTRDAARVTPLAPYLVLHPVGFSLPALSPMPRCALTAPFHPCLIRNIAASAIGGSFSVALSRTRTASQPRGWVAVSHHRTLWCSDFPPGVSRAIA